MQHISSASQRETRASADPVAKYRPLGSNSMQMQLAGWAWMASTVVSSG